MKTTVTLLLCVILVGLIVFLQFDRTVRAQNRVMVDGSTYRLALELGLTPEVMILAKLEDRCSQILSSLDLATDLRRSLQSTRQAMQEIGDQILAFGDVLLDGDEAAQLAYQEALDTYGIKQRQFKAIHTDLVSTVIASLPQDARLRLQTCRNATLRQVPPEFKVGSHSKREWKMLERAVKAENRAQRMGTDLDPAHADVLADVRADFNVIEAKQRLNTKLDDVKVLFQQFNR